MSSRVAIDSLASGDLPFYVVPDVQTADYADRGLADAGLALPGAAPAGPSVAGDPLARRRRFPSPRAQEPRERSRLLKKAAEISARGHTEAMKAAAPGCGENEIQALLEGGFRRFGGDRPGYGSIVGSGPNATILHYMKDDRTMRDGELLLIDAATSYEHYSADVTRTFPGERPVFARTA